jgi:hypothetical protein
MKTLRWLCWWCSASLVDNVVVDALGADLYVLRCGTCGQMVLRDDPRTIVIPTIPSMN